ncbi:replicative DNA helicase [Streptomyces sp. NPDC057429]|uniref:replicative DNA helicase n=1 Tax=Streptomyces sp. NPDC057429 TaxID=3346130 RepID=UPI0036912765
MTSLVTWLARRGASEGQGEKYIKDSIKQLLELREVAHVQILRPGTPKHGEDSRPKSETPAQLWTRPPGSTMDVVRERKILGCVLLSRDAFADVVEILQPTDFTENLHRKIYIALLELYANAQELSVDAVISYLDSHYQLPDAAKIIHGLVLDAPDPREAAEHAEVASDREMVRSIVRGGKRVAQSAETAILDDDPNADALLDIVEDEFLLHIGKRNSILRAGESTEGVLGVIEAAEPGNPIGGVATGFTDLDSLILGFRPGQLILMAGASGMGKSTLCLNFISTCTVTHSHTSLFASLQMDRDEMVLRATSSTARVAVHRMRSGVMSDDEWARVAKAMPLVTESPLHIVDEANYTVESLHRTCRRLRHLENLKLVVIDSIDHFYVAPDRSSGSHESDMAAIARDLRKMARELDIPVVAGYDMGRLPERYSDILPNLRDIPGRLESVADVVILLHREDAYEMESPRAGEADLVVARNRYGYTGKVTLAFQGHYSRFVDMAGI